MSTLIVPPRFSVPVPVPVPVPGVLHALRASAATEASATPRSTARCRSDMFPIPSAPVSAATARWDVSHSEAELADIFLLQRSIGRFPPPPHRFAAKQFHVLGHRKYAFNRT